MRLRFATISGVGGARGAGAAGGGEDADVLTALSVDEGDDDILACTYLRGYSCLARCRADAGLRDAMKRILWERKFRSSRPSLRRVLRPHANWFLRAKKNVKK